MKKLLLHFLIFFVYSFNTYAQQPVVNDYSGDYILNGEVANNPAKGSYDVQKTLKIEGDVMYIRLKDVYDGSYELNWRTPQGAEFPESVEESMIFISADGKIEGEFNCLSKQQMFVKSGEYRGKYSIGTYKCIIEGEFEDGKNKKLKLYYKLFSTDGRLIFEGWREGKRRKSF